MHKLILIGAGGHSKVIQDIVAANTEFNLYAILDDTFEELNEVDGVIFGNTSFLESLKVEEYKYCIAIGNNAVRKKLFDKFSISIEQYASLIHPSAIISKSAGIGYGTVVMPNAVVNANTVVGNHCIINTGAVIEHDNRIGDYMHISPNATLAGTVSVGAGTHIGAGAVVIPGKCVGSWSNVGAGGVVVNDIGDRVTAVGVPAKVIK